MGDVFVSRSCRHGDRKGRHYYTTALEAASFVYRSGDPCGRHVSFMHYPVHSPINNTPPGASQKPASRLCFTQLMIVPRIKLKKEKQKPYEHNNYARNRASH